MSQIVHMFCFNLCMITGSAGKPIDLSSIEKISFRDFHDGLWNCEINLANNVSKIQYALAHMQQLLYNMHTSRFYDSLRIIAE